jgi:4a-hydroxytetrahydrobiopterin dehydratase
MAYSAKEIEEKLTLKCFDESIRIANEIAKIANQLNHHPELVFKHNELIIRTHTHSASGITDKDFELAEKIDQLLLI